MQNVLPARRPLRKVRPPSGLAAFDFAELWAYRDLLSTLAARDVMLRYRQTILGVAWVLIQPLIGAALNVFVFGVIFGLAKKDPANYFLLTLTGQIFYAAYAGTLTKAAGSLLGNTGLVSKVYFPRLILPVSTVASSLIDFGVGLCLLVPLLFLFRIVPGFALLTMPLWFVMGMLLSLGWGLITAALMVSYRDVAYILPVVMQFLSAGAPVGWTLSRIPSHWLPYYLIVNPLATLIEGFRWSLISRGGAFPISDLYVVYAALVSIGIFALGAVVFRNLERRFADVI